MRHLINILVFVACSLVIVNSNTSAQSSANNIRESAKVIPIISEPAPKLVAEAPIPEKLAKGTVIIPYKTINLRILPVFGDSAVSVSPRIGHLHITVDDNPWHWADASNNPIIVAGLTPGPHKILIELADPAHKVIEGKTVFFVVPEIKKDNSSHH